MRLFPLVQASAVEWKTFLSVEDTTELPLAQCYQRDPITLPSFEQKAQHSICWKKTAARMSEFLSPLASICLSHWGKLMIQADDPFF